MSDGAAAIGAEYQVGHSQSVTVSHGGSDMLAFQVSQGASADVLITADLDAMDIIRKRHEAEALATSELVVAAVDGIEDFNALAKAGVKIAVAAKEVPAGRYTIAALAQLEDSTAKAILANVVTEEPNVRSALTKVTLGEVDAAFVYNTDLKGADLKRIELPVSARQRATYYIVALTAAGNEYKALALTSPGREVLAKLGFGKPQ
jgi:molybdate transport system substrate-binding protein